MDRERRETTPHTLSHEHPVVDQLEPQYDERGIDDSKEPGVVDARVQPRAEPDPKWSQRGEDQRRREVRTIELPEQRVGPQPISVPTTAPGAM